MAEEGVENTGAETTTTEDVTKAADDKLKASIEAGIAEALKPIKEKLDGAYAERDAARAALEKIDADKKAADLERLKEQGKHKEAFEIELAAERSKREEAERKAISLTRDVMLKDALSTLDFRHEKAFKMASSEITSQLVQDETGKWVHATGVSIADFVKVYSEDESNSFLFKQKLNSGGGGKPPAKNNSGGDVKSLFTLSQAEVLKLATEGKLPRQR
jgi:hypothetical protein